MEKFKYFISDQKIECLPNIFSKGNDLIHFIVKNANTNENLKILVKYLDTYPQKINIKNNINFTPLMIACINTNKTSSLDCVKILLDKGADPNIKNEAGWTVFTFLNYYPNISSYKKCIKLLKNYTV